MPIHIQKVIVHPYNNKEYIKQFFTSDIFMQRVF